MVDETDFPTPKQMEQQEAKAFEPSRPLKDFPDRAPEAKPVDPKRSLTALVDKHFPAMGGGGVVAHQPMRAFLL